MKKFFGFLLIVGICVGGYFVFKNIKNKKYIEEVKNGWYVEIIYDKPINVRDMPSTEGESIGKAKKGEFYKKSPISKCSQNFILQFKNREITS
jgi:hypothetical protein